MLAIVIAMLVIPARVLPVPVISMREVIGVWTSAPPATTPGAPAAGATSA